MGKSLIITEKPSVAQEFAKVLRVSGRNDGYIENGEYVISWCVGHLVGLVYPESYDMKYKKWRLEDLPFLPKEYKYDVIDSVRKQYNIVHALLQREDIDRVYWAGDAGKEGQTIEENIRNFGGVREGMEELRVWIDSQTEEEILRGIKRGKADECVCKPRKERHHAYHRRLCDGHQLFACHVGQIRQSAKRCGGYTLVHGNRGRTSDDLCAWNGSNP